MDSLSATQSRETDVSFRNNHASSAFSSKPSPPGGCVSVEARRAKSGGRRKANSYQFDLANGICRSDWHLWQGDWEWVGFKPPLPFVLGHESAGVVEEVGKNVNRFKIGDRVVFPFSLASFFESHPKCPDEPTDDEIGWKPWAMEKTDELLEDAAARILEAKGGCRVSGTFTRIDLERCAGKLSVAQKDLLDAIRKNFERGDEVQLWNGGRSAR